MLLGIPHPDYLLDMLDSIQLEQWSIYLERHPAGSDVDQAMIAQLTAVTAAAAGDSSAKTQDFLPFELPPGADLDDPEALLGAMPGGEAAIRAIVDKQKQTDPDEETEQTEPD